MKSGPYQNVSDKVFPLPQAVNRYEGYIKIKPTARVLVTVRYHVRANQVSDESMVVSKACESIACTVPSSVPNSVSCI